MIQKAPASRSWFTSRNNFSLIKAQSWWLAIALSLYSFPAVAQALEVVTIDKNIVNQPITMIGTSGGNLRAPEIALTDKTATGFCDGYVNSQPNHLLKIESFFESLRLEVKSIVDTTLLVKGSSGVWCSDDSGSANPMIEGQWQQGTYKIWVGSYQPNTSNSYQIKITGR